MNGITLDEKDLKRLCNKMCQSYEKCNEVVCDECNFNTTKSFKLWIEKTIKEGEHD